MSERNQTLEEVVLGVMARGAHYEAIDLRIETGMQVEQVEAALKRLYAKGRVSKRKHERLNVNLWSLA
jgi:hypothetical protein